VTAVRNLATGEVRVYDQPATVAVVLAFYQSQRNMNWWSYPDWSVEFGPSGRTVFRGDWAGHLGAQQKTLFDAANAGEIDT
jgi:hypothetical protein